MLTVLITNIALWGRSGTEVVVEQLADGLRRRGHRPVMFAPALGHLAEEMLARGHYVVDRPSALPWKPDVIHGHHTGPTMAAMAACPGVPSLFVCHSSTAPFDAAPRHPRLRRLYAVDERCRARLVSDGAPPGDVLLLPNAVDLSRIPARASGLPTRPRRALALTKHGAHLPALRAACAAAGIALEEYGHGAGRMTATPEALFAEADLVFATARSAMEAAAAGAGVVVCDARGLAGFLTHDRARAWLPWNLGAAVLREPTEPATVAAAIAEWSAEEATRASALLRAEHSLDALLDRLEGIYAGLLDAPAPAPSLEAAAVGDFLAAWVPSFDAAAPWKALADSVLGQPRPLPFDVQEHIRASAAAQERMRASLEQLAERQGLVAAERDALARQNQHGSELSDLMRGMQELRVGQEELRRELRNGVLARAYAFATAVWRRLVPRAVRAPLHRARRKLMDAAGR